MGISTKEMTVVLEKALLALDRLKVFDLITEARDALTPAEFSEKVMTPALTAIGDGWQSGAVALSQVYMSGRICEDVVAHLFPETSDIHDEPPGGVGMAVLCDRHLLGKRIVTAVLRSAGISVLDFGALDPEPLVAKSLDAGIDILLISTLMLPSALHVKEVAPRLKAAGIRVAVGGAPFLMDEALWREVGADAMGRSASDAIRIIHRFREEAA